MVCCGLCLGPLGFRLHCILLNECGLCIASACEVTIQFVLFFRPVFFFISLRWFLSHIFLDFGGVGYPRKAPKKRGGEQSRITDHFSSPLRFGIKQNHGCSCLGGKERTRSWCREESCTAAETKTTQKSQKDCLLWGRDHRPEDKREAAPAGQGECVRRLFNHSYFIMAIVIPGGYLL